MLPCAPALHRGRQKSLTRHGRARRCTGLARRTAWRNSWRWKPRTKSRRAALLMLSRDAWRFWRRGRPSSRVCNEFSQATSTPSRQSVLYGRGGREAIRKNYIDTREDGHLTAASVVGKLPARRRTQLDPLRLLPAVRQLPPALLLSPLDAEPTLRQSKHCRVSNRFGRKLAREPPACAGSMTKRSG
jgi:hypothetical protein